MVRVSIGYLGVFFSVATFVALVAMIRKSVIRMRASLLLLCLLCAEVASAFRPYVPLQRVASTRCHAIKLPVDPRVSGRADEDPPQVVSTSASSTLPMSISEMIRDVGRNAPSMVDKFFTEALLLQIGIIAGFFLGVDVLRTGTLIAPPSLFDREMWRVVLPCFGGMLGLTLFSTVAPFEPFQRWGRKARFSALQSYGLMDSKTALTSHLFMAVVVGLAEEVAFRGFLYGWLENVWGPFPALFAAGAHYNTVNDTFPFLLLT